MSRIENAKIISVDLSMADHGCLTLSMCLEGAGWGVIFGGRVLGKGYVGAKDFKGSPKGIEEIMRIMDVVGSDTFNGMKGKYIRVEVNGADFISKIGNIIEDKWFDYREFYKEENSK